MQDEKNENIDSLNDTDTVDTESTGADTSNETTSESIDVDVSKLLETNKRLFERAKKAEADLKAIKSSTNQSSQQSSATQIDVDERILKANGTPEVLLKELKAIATLRGVSLIDAQSDKLYIAVKSQYEKEEKHKAASLGASRGSANVQTKKTLNTANLTREEHMKLVKGL